MKKQSTIFMEMLTAVGMFIGIIFVLLSIFGIFLEVGWALIITCVLTFSGRIIGYCLDRIADKSK